MIEQTLLLPCPDENEYLSGLWIAFEFGAIFQSWPFSDVSAFDFRLIEIQKVDLFWL